MNLEAKRHIMSSDFHIFLSYRMSYRSDPELGKSLEDISSFLRRTWNSTQADGNNDLDVTVQQDRDCIIGI